MCICINILGYLYIHVKCPTVLKVVDDDDDVKRVSQIKHSD